MLLIEIDRDGLLKPLQCVTGVVERRHTLPILSNVLIEKTMDRLSFLATDLEIQISSQIACGNAPADFSIRTLESIGKVWRRSTTPVTHCKGLSKPSRSISINNIKYIL